jgi:hypothetical protein
MCCKIYDKRTKRVLRTLKEHGGKCIMWKVLYKKTIIDGKWVLIAPWRETHYDSGWNISDRESKTLTKFEKASHEIHHGLHVFTNKPSAIKFAHTWEVVVPVVVYKKDFLAAGKSYDAVFTKIFIKKKDFNEALQT